MKWYEALSVKQLLHWETVGRSGASVPVIFPDLVTAPSNLSKKFKKKRAVRNGMAKQSRRANR